MDRKSQVQCLADCRAMLAKGASVLFFPEGTRSLDARLASFKKGAFTVAAKAKVLPLLSWRLACMHAALAECSLPPKFCFCLNFFFKLKCYLAILNM